MAYAAGLALFRQRLEQCRDDLFLATCSLERLARWEELLDLPVARTDEASRREMAAVKLSIGEGDFTPEGIRRSLLAGCRSGSGTGRGFLPAADPGHRCPDHRRLPDPGRSQGPGAGRMLPAHLEVEFDIGVLTWEMFEAIGLDFAAWDSRDFTWEWFDLNGEKLGGE